MKESTLPQSKAKRKRDGRHKDYLEIVQRLEVRDMLIDFAAFTKKYSPANISRILGVSNRNVNRLIAKGEDTDED